MKAKKNVFFLLLLSLMLVLSACSGGNSSTPTNGNTNAGSGDGEEVAGQEGGELVYVVPSDAPTLDPHGMNDTATTNVTTQLFDRLTAYEADGTVIPSLAESWEAVDETTWEFKLRDDVKFHDGTDFTADAVKMTIERIIDPEFASPRAVVLNMITEVVVVDDYTVQIGRAHV